MSHSLYEHLLEPAYLSRLQQRSLAELRAMRMDCERAEAEVSFARRVLHGRLDIIVSEQQRRREGHGRDLTELVARLPVILADQPSSTTQRVGRMLLTPPPDCVRDELVQMVDEAAGAATLGALAQRGDEDVEQLATSLRSIERDLSATRHELHQRIDALQREITERYQRGEASLEGLLA